MYALPCFLYAESVSLGADVVFLYAEKLRKIAVAEAVQLSLLQDIGSGQAALAGEKLFLLLHEFLHLLDEPALDLGELEQLVNRSALAQRFIHNELALAGGVCEL